ncbi:MAG: hypothetical protein GX434_01305 [Peptococcaceae bacterium]|nr:hypothetical protein [Peptococcaceae bacterium]
MSEAEVSLRLALYLIKNHLVKSNVSVALDGAQIKTGNEIHFPIEAFLTENLCENISQNPGWQGVYKLGQYEQQIEIHSYPGKGDVIARLKSGST